MDLECQWTALEEPYGRWLGVALALTGSAGAALSGWLAGALLLGGRRQRRASSRAATPSASPAAASVSAAGVAPPTAHLLLLAVALAALGRALLAGFPFSAAAALAGRWVFGRGCCALFAALRLLLEAALRFALVLLTVERCALSSAGHWRSPPSLRRYLWAVAGCWVAAGAWASSPLLGWGRFGCDVTGFWCELDWRPDTGLRTSFNLTFLLLGIVGPEIFGCFCALVALCRFRGSCNDADGQVEKEFDKAALGAAAGQLLCGLPRVTAHALLLSGWRLLPVALRFGAPLALEVVPSVTTLALLAAGPRVRAWLLGVPSGGRRRRSRPRNRTRRPTGARLLSTS